MNFHRSSALTSENTRSDPATGCNVTLLDYGKAIVPSDWLYSKVAFLIRVYSVAVGCERVSRAIDEKLPSERVTALKHQWFSARGTTCVDEGRYGCSQQKAEVRDAGVRSRPSSLSFQNHGRLPEAAIPKAPDYRRDRVR